LARPSASREKKIERQKKRFPQRGKDDGKMGGTMRRSKLRAITITRRDGLKSRTAERGKSVASFRGSRLSEETYQEATKKRISISRMTQRISSRDSLVAELEANSKR
jgi:hypothetical protein